MQFTELLKQLAGKLNLQENADLATAIASLGTIEVPEALAKQLNEGLMSFDGAKNNIQLLNHFKPTILNAVDDQFAILAEKYGMGDAMRAEKSTYKKAAILETELARRIEEAQSKAGDKEARAEITKLNNQLASLQAQLSRVNDEKTAELQEITKRHDDEKLGMLIDFELGSKNYANKNLDKRVSVITARTLLNEALKESKAIVVNEDGQLRLKQAENASMDYVDKGFKPVSFQDFTNKLLADSHLLEVSTPAPQVQQVAVPQPANAPHVSSSFADAIAGATLNN